MTAKIRWGTGWVDVDYNGYGEIADTSKEIDREWGEITGVTFSRAEYLGDKESSE